MSNDPLSTILRFVRFVERRSKLKDITQKEIACIRIQRAFRGHLLKLDRIRYYMNFSAMKIQRFWRHMRKISPKSVSPFHAAQSPRIKRRKTIVDLPPPWKSSNANKFSKSDIDKMLANQQADVKWVSSYITAPLREEAMQSIASKDDYSTKAKSYLNREVVRSFFTFIPKSNLRIGSIVSMFAIEPTFSIAIVTKSSIMLHSISIGKISSSVFPFPFSICVIDTSYDRLSGRIFLLLSDWSMAVFENGIFSQPKSLLIPRFSLPQSKYIECDKFGYLWLFSAQSLRTTYCLDSLNFSTLSVTKIMAGERIADIVPLFDKHKWIGFLMSSKTSANILIIDVSGKAIGTISRHSSFSPKFVVNSDYLFTYGEDKKLNIFKRTGLNFTFAKCINLSETPNSVAYIKYFSAIAVGTSSSTIRIFSLYDECYHTSLPRKDIFSKPEKTKKGEIYGCIESIRVPRPVINIRCLQFSKKSAFLAIGCDGGIVVYFWVCKTKFTIKAFQYDLMEAPPFLFPPISSAGLLCQREFRKIERSIEAVRSQIADDSNYLRQIAAELEKRYLQICFKTPKPGIADIMMESPFRRWIRYLREFGQNLSIYELYYLIEEHVSPLIQSPKELVEYIGSTGTIGGCYQNLIVSQFDTDSVQKAVYAASNLICNEIRRYTSLRDNVLSLPKKTASSFFKSMVKDYNLRAIHRMTEIENIVKNRIRDISLSKGKMAQIFRKRRPPTYIKLFPCGPEISNSIFNTKLIHPSNYLLPEPLFEAYRYKPTNAPKSESYCAYGPDGEAARVLNFESPISQMEISYTRPLSRLEKMPSIYGVSKDLKTVVLQYPVGYVPLSYILESNPFASGIPNSVSVGRMWLSQLLVILASLHKQGVVVRCLLPSNILISNDGANVFLFSLSDSAFPSSKPSPLNLPTLWLPPEFFASKEPTPAFDIFQFGILLVEIFLGIHPRSFGESILRHLRFRHEDPLEIAKSKRFFYDPFDGIQTSKFPIYQSISDLVIACLDIDPNRRPTAIQILDNPLFNLSSSAVSKASTLGYGIIRSVPHSIFISGVLGSLIKSIENELPSNDSSALVTAVGILGFFMNSADDSHKILLPINQSTMSEVVDEVFRERVFDKVVDYIVRHLQNRFESETDIESDKSFDDLVELYHQFFRSCIEYPSVFAKVLSSFKVLVLGTNRFSESSRLFCFLHSKLRPMVEFFFLKVPSKIRELMKMTEFYSSNFIVFYDNIRELAEAIKMKSELKYASSIDFIREFIERFPCDDTMKLIDDFRVDHKIEIGMAVTSEKVKAAVMKLFLCLLGFENLPLNFFSGFSFGILLPLAEEAGVIEIIEKVVLSQPISSIISLLNNGILDRLTEIKQGKSLMKKLIGESSIITSVIYCSPSLSEFMKKDLPKPETRNFLSMISSVNGPEIYKSVETGLLIAEKSPITQFCESIGINVDQFKESLTVLSDILAKSKKFGQAFLSILKIWDTQKWDMQLPLVRSVVDSFFIDPMASCSLLSLSHRDKLPDYCYQLPEFWIKYITQSFDSIQAMTNSRKIDYPLLESYPKMRKIRLMIFNRFLTHLDTTLSIGLVLRTDFLGYLFNNLLLNLSKFEINLKVVPPEFAPFNRTYPIRSEAISFIREIIKNRASCESIFNAVSASVRKSAVLSKEYQLLMKVADKDLRRTSIELLSALTDYGDPFSINEAIFQSELLMALREETISDWDDFTLLQKVWLKSSPKAESPDSQKALYEYSI